MQCIAAVTCHGQCQEQRPPSLLSAPRLSSPRGETSGGQSAIEMYAVRALVLCTLTYAVCTAPVEEIPCVCSGERTECSDHGKTTVRPNDVCPLSTVLVFCDNALTALPRGLDTRVQELDMARNRIAVAGDEIRGLSGLRRLDLNDNLLEHLRFLPQPCGLKVLDVSGNRVASLEGLGGCSALEELRLAGNRLTSVPDGAFAALNGLTTLSLGDNSLGSLSSGAFRGLVNLRSLDVHGTDLETLPDGAFSSLTELRSLNLDANHLRAVTSGAFRGLSRLTDLHLCDNHISSLATDAFSETRNLSALYLDRNELPSLPEGVLTGLPLEELWMRGNHLEALPVLRACCLPRLRVAALDDNRVAAPAEAAVRALLRAGVERASLEGNPVRPEALAWAAGAQAGVELRPRGDDCHCGAVALRDGPAVTFCVDAPCDPDWVTAVRAAAAA